jgi:hypothetical protein
MARGWLGLLVLAAVQGVHALEFDLPVRTANSKTQPAAKCILEETNANVRSRRLSHLWTHHRTAHSLFDADNSWRLDESSM